MNTGENCLKQVELALPELILLDINMPGMDGHEAGGNEDIIKPIEPEDLHSKISSCLYRQQTVTTARSSASEAT